MSHKLISRLMMMMIIILLDFAACAGQSQTPAYDPNKQYVAFLVVNTPQSAEILKNVKQRSTVEGFESGPVVYYEPGITDFAAPVNKLIASKQVILIWVIGSLFDSPNIQKALSAAGYEGQVRYAPVTGTLPQTSQ